MAIEELKGIVDLRNIHFHVKGYWLQYSLQQKPHQTGSVPPCSAHNQTHIKKIQK